MLLEDNSSLPFGNSLDTGVKSLFFSSEVLWPVFFPRGHWGGAGSVYRGMLLMPGALFVAGSVVFVAGSTGVDIRAMGNKNHFIHPDWIFDTLRGDKKEVLVNEFLMALEGSGLRKTDPRLEQVMKLLDDFSREPQRENDGPTSPLSVRLNPEVFKEIISPNVRLISQAFTNQLIVPDFTEFCDQIKMFYDKCKTNQDGKVASYIPQLAKMTSSYWGVSVCTIDGQRCSFGDTNIPFTLQSCRENYILCWKSALRPVPQRSYSPDSNTCLTPPCSITQVLRVAQTDVERQFMGKHITTWLFKITNNVLTLGCEILCKSCVCLVCVPSKPLTYAIALEELGNEEVHTYVGQEPSGRMFNELVLDSQNKPHNPMVNAGAIMVCALLQTLVKPTMTLPEKFDFLLNYLRRMAGGESIEFNNAVFMSERDHADRNYALGFLMSEYKCFPKGSALQECMDFYFQDWDGALEFLFGCSPQRWAASIVSILFVREQSI
uniref:glutaminase n=1 Tax=Timema poppense TaxID=170557 RepID=A0A7R9DFQ0_TIMPO|nr:unnamed protein product [Timema poppensis]